jgi:flagellar biosynthesis protein FliQ
MTADQSLFVLSDMLWAVAIICAPILIITLIVGIVISVFQVATQIQEMTLSYVPKLAAAALTLILLGGWMIGRMTQFAEKSLGLISSIN